MLRPRTICAVLNMAEEEEEVSFFEELTKSIQTNKEFLLEVFGKWSKASSRQFCAKIAVVLVVIAISGGLTAIDRISGETLAGIIGVVLGYILGKGVL
jgi:hypothetical protein